MSKELVEFLDDDVHASSLGDKLFLHVMTVPGQGWMATLKWKDLHTVPVLGFSTLSAFVLDDGIVVQAESDRWYIWHPSVETEEEAKHWAFECYKISLDKKKKSE